MIPIVAKIRVLYVVQQPDPALSPSPSCALKVPNSMDADHTQVGKHTCRPASPSSEVVRLIEALMLRAFRQCRAEHSRVHMTLPLLMP